MSEKVLGFYKKDVSDRPLGKLYGSYTIHQDKLVPVVSVEWLEKWSSERVKKAILESGSNEWNTTEYDSGVGNGIKEACNDLSKAVRLQVELKMNPKPISKKAINAIINVIGYIIAQEIADEINEPIILETGIGNKTRLKIKIKPKEAEK